MTIIVTKQANAESSYAQIKNLQGANNFLGKKALFRIGLGEVYCCRFVFVFFNSSIFLLSTWPLLLSEAMLRALFSLHDILKDCMLLTANSISHRRNDR